SFINGSENRIEGLKITIKAETAGVTEFGKATLHIEGPAMGVCVGKNLFCAQPDPALGLALIATLENEEQLAELMVKTLSRPKVRTSIEAAKELPFMLVQATTHNQIIPDQFVSISFKRESIERKIERASGMEEKRKRRLIKRRKRRPRRRR
ncbi:MAG: hypothetical protein OSB21_14830, partial [Myxococcota bacterium]|nr:hypothetical protein [Myxococcota bacterium]